ncbi:MAG: right-handed parallel beta-helix repeat-containing protein [Acidobacteriota bacterium]|nr:MAG: right-handed parallel beta-helix repeat-containing protein [Acidobacteriota bacterium]
MYWIGILRSRVFALVVGLVLMGPLFASTLSVTMAIDGETICVDQRRGRFDATGDCSIGADGYWRDPLSTLEEALARVSSGDAIWIAAGSYAENDLVVAGGVSLLGGFDGTERSPDARETWINRVIVTRAAPADTPVLAMMGENVLDGLLVLSNRYRHGNGVSLVCPLGAEGRSLALKDVTLVGHESGVILDWELDPYAPKCTISLIAETLTALENTNGLRASVEEVSDARVGLVLEISRSSFFSNSNAGIDLATPTSFTALEEDVLVQDGLFVNNGDGIALQIRWGGAYLEIVNSLFANRGTGLYIMARSAFKRLEDRSEVSASDSFDMHIARNTIVGNSVGMFFDQDYLIQPYEISRNYIARNLGSGIFTINSSGALAASVTGNWIIDNGGIGFVHGGHVCGVARLERNKISGNSHGLWSRDNDCDRFIVGGRADRRNDLSGNDGYCLGYDGLSALAAEENFWGTDDPLAIEGCIDGRPVDYAPWYWPPSGEPADGAPRHVEVFPLLTDESGIHELAPDDSRRGGRVLVSWVVDMANSAARLEQFQGSLRWDPRLLRFVGWSAGPAEFDVTCGDLQADDGLLVCSGLASEASAGQLRLVEVILEVQGPALWPSILDLELTRLVAASPSPEPGEDLTEIVIAHDGYLLPSTGMVIGGD